MKPLKQEVIGENLTPKNHRDCMVDMARQPFGCCVKYEDGSFHQITIDSNDEVKIEDYEPWYEFDDEEEVKKYIETDNEAFDNYIRWQRLQKIFTDEIEDPFKK